MMAAQLRLPADMPAAEKEELTESLIKRLGLTNAADTVVGDAKTRGLSGGCGPSSLENAISFHVKSTTCQPRDMR